MPKNRPEEQLGTALELSGARCGHPVCPISNYLRGSFEIRRVFMVQLHKLELTIVVDVLIAIRILVEPVGVASISERHLAR